MNDDRVWRIDRGPEDLSRRMYARVGTPRRAFERCTVCHRRVVDFGEPPITVQWLYRELDALGDFVWSSQGESDAFVSPAVAAALGKLSGVELGDVVVAERVYNEWADREGAVLSAKRRARLSVLRQLRTTALAPMLMERSNLIAAEGATVCQTCGYGQIVWEPLGPRAPGVPQPSAYFVPDAEYLRRTSQGIDALGELYETFEREPGDEGKGAVFSRGDLEGAQLWRPTQHPFTMLCTSDFKRAVASADASNVDFLRVGYLVD